MKLELFHNEAAKIWKRVTEQGENPNELLQLELDLYKKLLIFFQVGESCYMIFSFNRLQFDFVSNEISEVLGYTREEFNVDMIMKCIHPDDRAWFLNCQDAAGSFLLGLTPEKQMKYKLRFDYRMKKKDGEYLRIMQQVVVVQNDNEGKILRTLIVLTDISHLKKDGEVVMSYIGMDGEPSYLNVNVQTLFLEKSRLLSKREKEVLCLMTEGQLSKQIADTLCISKHTVDSHRKNLLKKTRSASTAELVNKAIKDGLI
ncbi:MAG: PAS domain-containing protein [Bacteroidetes bacterium]|nr:PAS domain-containing protein [Bacteroidota bacterium]